MDLFDPTDTNYREGDISRRCNSSLVVAWLRDHYRLGKSGSISKNSVYMLYLEACRVRGLETDINSTFFGKLVKKAFPGIQYNRKGPRGRSEHHYKLLKRVKLNPPSHGHAGVEGLPAPADQHSSSPAIGLCHFLPVVGPTASAAPPLLHTQRCNNGHSQGQDFWPPLPFLQQQQQPPPPQPQPHCGGSNGTHLLPVGGTSSVEMEAIGITSSRSPSPPSSPPAPYHHHDHHLPLYLHAPSQHRHYQPRHDHQHQAQYPFHQHQHHHHQQQQLPALYTTGSSGGGGGGGRMDPPGRCDHPPTPSSTSASMAMSSPCTCLSSPRSSPVSRRANSPLGVWDAMPPECASATTTGAHYDKHLAPAFSASRPTCLPSWSEWNFSKMVNPAEPIPAAHHYHPYPAQYLQHDQKQYRPATTLVTFN